MSNASVPTWITDTWLAQVNMEGLVGLLRLIVVTREGLSSCSSVPQYRLRESLYKRNLYMYVVL